ncbi:GreA/GreB family elongation factor [Neptunomonas qingdaonensis]|uniref:Transcription elongation factor, GreA/GreB, C-term n=1 Tax=Neptunomonas qingdaonensis TaxID=1045558 RepID=A0A1I2SXG7_9GAMM|nr:GreA/GreB family elongation factor [Neptunomonas qingdaonensis]SFG55677.1 Transcription elongation factor, GreA/GreB, C-term [Neptunomonas qingdaonensis]
MFAIPLSNYRYLINKLYRYILANDSLSYSKPYHLLSVFNVLDSLKNQSLNQANIGDTVLISFVDTQEKLQLTLVNADKVTDDEKNISVLSPLGSALLGRSKGECFSVNILNSSIDCKLLKIVNK